MLITIPYTCIYLHYYILLSLYYVSTYLVNYSLLLFEIYNSIEQFSLLPKFSYGHSFPPLNFLN